MLQTLSVLTGNRTEFIELTAQIQAAVQESGVREGLCHLFVPHTTAAITINENADPSVQADILMVLNKIISDREPYRHLEGNSRATSNPLSSGRSSPCWSAAAAWCWAPGRASISANSTALAPAACTSRSWRINGAREKFFSEVRLAGQSLTDLKLGQAPFRDRQLLKEFLEYVHLKKGCWRPTTPTTRWSNPGVAALFRKNFAEYNYLPSFSMVAFNRPLSYQDEIFQFDLLHPLGDGKRRGGRENLEKIQPHLDRTAGRL